MATAGAAQEVGLIPNDLEGLLFEQANARSAKSRFIADDPALGKRRKRAPDMVGSKTKTGGNTPKVDFRVLALTDACDVHQFIQNSCLDRGNRHYAQGGFDRNRQ